jgi:hypothetical protein
MASKIIIAAGKPIYRPGRGGPEHAAKHVLARLRWVYDVMTISPPSASGSPLLGPRIPTVPLADHGEINIR